MTTTLPFGTLELPGTWENQSTYHFVGTAPLPTMPHLVGTGAKPREANLTVTVTTGTLPPLADVRALLAEQEREYARSFNAFRVASRAAWTHPRYGEVPALDFSFEPAPGVVVRQRQLYLRWPASARFTCLALASEAVTFDAVAPTLRQIFDSFALPE